jgi:hypothetical protein
MSFQAHRDTASDGSYSLQPYDDAAAGFVDEGLEPDTTYYYRIRATNDGGSSDLSSVVSATTGPDTLDACDTLEGWSSPRNALSLDTAEKREGSASIVSTGVGPDEFWRVFDPPFDSGLRPGDAYLQFWYFVSDPSALTDDNQVELGSGGDMDIRELNWSLRNLGDGWNFISLRITDAGTADGAADLHALNWFRIYNHKSASVTTRIDDLRLVGTASTGAPTTETVHTSDFESGGVEGWHRRRTSEVETVSVVSGVSHAGTYSLLTTGRTKTWHGPTHLLTDAPAPGDIYGITVWVFYESGPEQAEFWLTTDTSFSDDAGRHEYNSVAFLEVPRGTWMEIRGAYLVRGYSRQEDVEFYIETAYRDDDQLTPDDTIAFYIDDVTVARTSEG